MEVVCSLNSGRSCDQFLGTVTRNIWQATATLADTLSRWYGGQLHHSMVTELLSYCCPGSPIILYVDCNFNLWRVMELLFVAVVQPSHVGASRISGTAIIAANLQFLTGFKYILRCVNSHL